MINLRRKMSFFNKTYGFYSPFGTFSPKNFAIISAKFLLISILLLLIMNL